MKKLLTLALATFSFSIIASENCQQLENMANAYTLEAVQNVFQAGQLGNYEAAKLRVKINESYGKSIALYEYALSSCDYTEKDFESVTSLIGTIERAKTDNEISLDFFFRKL